MFNLHHWVDLLLTDEGRVNFRSFTFYFTYFVLLIFLLLFCIFCVVRIFFTFVFQDIQNVLISLNMVFAIFQEQNFNLDQVSNSAPLNLFYNPRRLLRHSDSGTRAVRVVFCDNPVSATRQVHCHLCLGDKLPSYFMWF